MNNQTVFPTKGNLLNIKKSLGLARMGFELMDRKRNILIREMMTLIDTAQMVRDQIDETYRRAYRALQWANVSLGICSEAAETTPIETGIQIRSLFYPNAAATCAPKLYIAARLWYNNT